MDVAALYCTSCGKEHRIPAAASWPFACECGNKAWSTVRPAQAMFGFGTIDAYGAASAALRQPGSPHIQPPA